MVNFIPSWAIKNVASQLTLDRFIQLSQNFSGSELWKTSIHGYHPNEAKPKKLCSSTVSNITQIISKLVLRFEVSGDNMDVDYSKLWILETQLLVSKCYYFGIYFLNSKLLQLFSFMLKTLCNLANVEWRKNLEKA